MTPVSVKKKKAASRRNWAGIGFAILVLVAGYGVYVRYWLPKDGLTDIFGSLGEHGYTPNIGFSGTFRPGNVVQVAEQSSDGKDRLLRTPLVFAWGSDCFPNQTPRTSEFTLPQTKGSSSASVTIGADAVNRLLPSLKIDTTGVVDYTLKIENTRVQTFAKADLSGAFSERCVAALREAIDGGDKVEWFQVVMESVVADGLSMELHWKANTAVEARRSLTDKVEKALAQVVTAKDKPGDDSAIKVGVAKADEKETILSATGLVIIGYRARPIQPDLSK